jgi:hypothetical protein
MADDKIKAYDRHGEKITIDKSEVGKLYALGGKLATKADISAHDVEAEYAKKSTAEKVAGLAVNASPLGAIYSQLSGNAALPPELEAYRSGVAKSTVVLPHAFKGAAGVVGGDEAAKQYVERHDRYQEASPVAAGLGEAAGTIGGALVGSGVGAVGKAAKFASPVGSVINSAGNLAERGVAGVLGSAAERGVLARAGVEATKMGARGAVEGALYSGAQSASEDLLHDRDVAVDKLFAASGTGAAYGFGGGFLLGGASSLASSGLGAARQKIAGMLAPKAEQAAIGGAEGTAYRTAGERAESIVAQPSSGSSVADFRANAPKATGEVAHSLALDSLGATKKEIEKAVANIPGGGKSVGEYVNRIHFAPTNAEEGMIQGAIRAATKGRADELLPAIAADKAHRIGPALSDALGTSPARVHMDPILTRANQEYQNMLNDPLRAAGAEAFRTRLDMELNALAESGRIGADGAMDAVDAFRLRSGLAKQAYELRKVNGSAGDAYKGFLRDFDSATISAIDKAAEEAGNKGVGDQIRYWKAEWQRANAAEALATKGASKVAGNNTFGLREGVGAAVGMATGHPLGAMATALGGKVLRERGAAAAAYVLNRVSQREVLARSIQKIDDQIGRASKGLLMPPPKGLPKAADRMPPAKELATKALATVADFQRDPEAHIEKVTRQVESIATHDPELADALVQRHVQAQTFLASKVPVTPDPDPLDPHPAPKMTPNEQAEFGRYAWYTEKPARFFTEVARGKLTFEGAETAKALMPRAFAELQSQTEEHLATMMAKGSKIPYRQRQYLGVLLDMAATPSQRPDHAAFLQANVSQDEPPPPPPKRSLMNGAKSHMSALDRLESNGVGRR